MIEEAYLIKILPRTTRTNTNNWKAKYNRFVRFVVEILDDREVDLLIFYLAKARRTQSKE